jgi:hypothetical protein
MSEQALDLRRSAQNLRRHKVLGSSDCRAHHSKYGCI